MSKGRDYIVHSIQPWDTYVATVLKYITMELCKKNRVLFLDTPLQRSFQLLRRNAPETQKYKRVFSGQDSDMIQINENLWVLYPKTVLESINWISNPAIFDSLNKVNDKRFARQVKYAADKLGFRDYVVLNDTSMINGFNFKELLKPSVQLYFLRDHITKVAYHARHGIRLEPLLIRKSDLVVTNSPYFSDYAGKYNPNSHFIGQGCDIDLYSDDDGSLKIPDELSRIPHPRIGYTGFLTSIRLDIDLLVHVAEQRPEWSLVLVGPEDQAFKDSKLHKLSNVHFLGGKPGNELPGYVKGFDVAINPQIINEITNINYPLKLDEYLAMGVPVVATKTWFMNFYFPNDSYLAANKEEYITEITKALSEDTPAKHKERIKVGRSHSWANFVEKIYQQVELLEKKQ